MPCLAGLSVVYVIPESQNRKGTEIGLKIQGKQTSAIQTVLGLVKMVPGSSTKGSHPLKKKAEFYEKVS